MDAMTKNLHDNSPSLRDSAFIRVREWEDPAVIHPPRITLSTPPDGHRLKRGLQPLHNGQQDVCAYARNGTSLPPGRTFLLPQPQHTLMITDREKAAFEAGIKLGALYHQFVGTPISRETADSVEAAIEQAVSLQPCVTDVRVRLNRGMMVSNRFGYSELAGKMFDAEVTTRVGTAVCRARLHLQGDYPMMEIIETHETARDTDHR